MPSTLNVLIEDKRINDILAATAAKDDGIPFLLLPVRIETRFMEVEKGQETIDSTGIDHLLDALLYIQVSLLDIKTAGELHGALPGIIKSIQAQTSAVKQYFTLASKEKNMLKQMAGSLGDIINMLVYKFVTETPTLNPLKDAVQQLQQAIAALVSDLFTSPGSARALLTELKATSKKIQQLADRKKTPYQNVKNKKDLYQFVQNTLQSAADALNHYKQIASSLTEMENKQFEQIQAHATSIQNQLNSVQANILSVHPDEGWKKFVNENLPPLVKNVQTQIGSFVSDTVPALKQVPKLQTYAARDMMFQSMKTLVAVKKLQFSGASDFSSLKTFKSEFSKRLQGLNQTLSVDFQISQRQSGILGKVYDQLNTELQVIQPQIGATPVKNKSQAFGRDTVNKYVTEKASGLLEKVKDRFQLPGTIPLTSHELWVRIYPDDIFIHTHEEDLSESEYEAGKRFWNAWWVASNDRELEKAAWKKLCAAFNSKRAGWIASRLDPRKSNIAANATKLQNKPFAHVAGLQQQAVALKTAIHNLKTNQQPADFWKNITVTQLTGIQTSTTTLSTSISTLTALPTLFIDRMQSELLIMQGDLQAIENGMGQLTEQQRQDQENKIIEFNKVAAAYTSLTESFKAIAPITVDAYLQEAGNPFEYPLMTLKENAWTIAPHTKTLPQRFVVITVRNKQFSHIVVGNPVPENLQLGPDPALFSNRDSDGEEIYRIDEQGNLVIEKGLQWMAEYREAIKQGMGITLPLTIQQYEEGFDQLFVLGINEKSAAETSALLEKLFTNHVYAADGMSFLKVGTATNNSEQDKSAYKPGNSDEDERFNIDILNQSFDVSIIDPFTMADGLRFSKALGISNEVSGKISHNNDRQISNSFVMNRALWNATLGHTMEEMWDHVFTYDNILRTEEFFTSYCTARGIIPSVRIGMQPYGLLTTTAYSRYEVYKDYSQFKLPAFAPSDFRPEIPNQVILHQKQLMRFEIRLLGILQILNSIWTKLRKEKVVDYSQLRSGNPQKKFMEMLGLNAVSSDFHYRYGVNIIRKGIYSPQMETDYDVRTTYGSEFIRELFKEFMFPARFSPSFLFRDETTPEIFTGSFKLEDAKYSRIRDQFQLSRIFRNRFIAPEKELRQLTGQRIDSQPLSFDALMESGNAGTYIDWLLTSSLDDILAGNNPANFPSRSLLFLMLRQSLMQAYQEGALSILQYEKLIPEDLRKIVGDEKTYSEFTGVGNRRKYNTKWHLLLKDFEELRGQVFENFSISNPFYNYLLGAVGGAAGRAAMSSYINKPDVNPIFSGYPNHATHRSLLKKVDTVRQSFSLLKNIPTAELSLLLSEHIDLCSYRLDAWFASFAHKRLMEQRQVKPQTVHLGAFGWVEGLRRDTNKDKAEKSSIDAELVQDETIVWEDPDNQGFIHAPSLNHAITAAVMRSAYKTNFSEEDINNRLSVNLSSSRVRAALKIIDGIRNGLSMGSILGFQFERGLHERYKTAELDKFILPFRKAFPLVVPVPDSADTSKPATYNSNVVDGLALLNKIYEDVKWLDFPANNTLYTVLMDPANTTVLKWLRDLVTNNGGNNLAYEQIAREIDRMGDAFDALGDIAISESVFQIVQGNHVRAGAMLTSLAQGKNIPEPQIAETPRSGTVVTHRVVLELQPVKNFSALSGWNAAATPRSVTEPTLDKWLSGIIGPANKIQYLVEYTEPGKEAKSKEHNIADCPLQAIDLLFLSANEADLQQTLGYHFSLDNPGLAAGTRIVVDTRSRLDTWTSDIRSLHELDLLFEQLRLYVLQAKPTGADSYHIQDAATDPANAGNYDAAEFSNRIQAAVDTMKKAIKSVNDEATLSQLVTGKIKLEAPANTLTEAQLNIAYAFLELAAQYGLPNALPRMKMMKPADEVEESENTVQQLISVYKQVNEKLEQVDALVKPLTSASTPKQQVAVYSDISRILFGKAYLALPFFKTLNFAGIRSQLDLDESASILRNGDALVMHDWLQGIAKVRPKMQAIQLTDMLQTAFRQPGFSMKPVQFNYRPGDYWLGIEYPATYMPAEDAFSVCILQPGQFPATVNSEQAGLVIDDWVEIIPNKAETTGITFHYNQPNATPPQSMLLAVTPAITGNWKWEDLVYTLIDTLEMAKNRAVEPDHIDQSELSHVLPGILSEVAPPQMADLGDANPLGVQVVMDFSFNKEPETE